jgi:hypothetical protein
MASIGMNYEMDIIENKQQQNILLANKQLVTSKDKFSCGTRK